MSDPFSTPPPYTYDDPRILYDQKCFFYNGGFDLVCLGIDPTPPEPPVSDFFRPQGAGDGFGYRKPVEPEYHWIDVRIKSCLVRVNHEKYEKDSYCSDVNFTGHLRAKNVAITNISSKILKRDIGVSSISYGSRQVNLEMDGIKIRSGSPLKVKINKAKVNEKNIKDIEKNKIPTKGDDDISSEIVKVKEFSVNKKKE